MAKKFSFDYTAGDILSMYQIRQNERDESRLRSLIPYMRSLCRLDHAVTIPAQYRAITKEVRTPFFRDSWHRITSSLIAKYPIIHANPLNERIEDHRLSANITERADAAMLERFNKELGEDIIFNLTAQEVRDGESVNKVVHRPTAFANFPLGASREDQDAFKRSAPFPIAWRDIDRLSMVFENGEYGDSWSIEYGEYAIPYLKSKYGMLEVDGRLIDPKRPLEGKSLPEGMFASSTGVRVKVEFFTDREWHVIIDGSEAPGWPKPNPYSPHLPYFRARAYDSESLLYSLLYLVPRLDELLTMKMNWSILGAYPNPVLESIPNSQVALGLDMPLGEGETKDDEKTAFTWVPGKLLDVPEGKKFGFISPPNVGRDLTELIQVFRSLVEIAGIPSVMRGGMPSGATGYLANQELAAASMAYRIASISGQRQLEKSFEFSHFLISNIVRQAVYVIGWDSVNAKTKKPTKSSKETYLALSPDESGPQMANLSKVGSMQVKFRPILPTDDQARAMIALQVTNASKPLYGRRQALETWMQEEDPDGILEELRVEEALDSEPLRSIAIQKALERAKLLPPKTNPEPTNPTSPMIPPGPSQLQPVTPAEESVLGTPSIQGQNMPIMPSGGRPAGSYPGQPGGPGNG